MLGLSYLSHYTPNEFVTFDKILEANESFTLPVSYKSYMDYYNAFKQETYLDKITVMNKENAIEEFSKLIAEFLDKTHMDPDSIAGIVYTDPVPFNSMIDERISVPHYLLEKFKFKNATVGIVQQQCTGTILSLALARGLLEEGQHLLILSSNYIYPLGNRNLGFTFMGDGLGLAVVSKKPSKWEIIDFTTKTYGKNTYNAYHHEEIVNTKDRMEVIKRGVNIINTLLARNHMTTKDLYKFVPQNINYSIYSYVYAKALGIKTEKIFFSNLSFGGHIGDVDLIRNLATLEEEENILDQSFVLLYGLGSNGLDTSYGAALLKFNKTLEFSGY